MGNLVTKLPGMTLKNPIIPASGTFGYGFEFIPYYDINILGSIMTKAVTVESRFGNPTPRIAETPSGMLNSVGLQNGGLTEAKDHLFPKLNTLYHHPVIANVSGSTIKEYLTIIEGLNDVPNIGAFEINISCPNVSKGGMAFGQDAAIAYEITKQCKAISKKPIYVKLSPNVTDIKAIALAVEKAGADAITLINTMLGMAIDIQTRRPILANRFGGLSGPAIKPIALRMVYQVYQAVKIPIIGMGGIMTAEDVIEFLLAGASAVAVGTANLIDPLACKTIIDALPETLKKYGFSSIENCIGGAHEHHHRL